ncbi:hypothetical protein DNA98_11530 [Meiothermus sp. Pnk-1]|nr:hypothetical protein DNA98_11530 [Meiothermus sp. Pnk-1]
MKRLWIALVAALAVSVASAQGRLFGEALGGELSLVPGFGLSLGATVGAERLLGPLDARGGVVIAAAGGAASFGLFADVLYPVQASNLNFNLGGGVGLTAGGATAFGLRGIAGLEFPLERYFSLRTELQLGVSFAGGGSGVGLSIVVGPRVYFP